MLKTCFCCVCDAGKGCEEQQFGDKGNNTKVSVGELEAEQ